MALSGIHFFFSPSTFVEAEAANTEAENFSYFSRANNVFCEKVSKTQPVQVASAFQTAGNKAVAASD